MMNRWWGGLLWQTFAGDTLNKDDDDDDDGNG